MIVSVAFYLGNLEPGKVLLLPLQNWDDTVTAIRAINPILHGEG